MKFIHNLRNKTEQVIINELGDTGFPTIIGGGNINEDVKVFIGNTQEDLNEKINNANSIEDAFNITFKPYIINGYDQRMSLENAFGYYSKTYNAYLTGVLSNGPLFYNYCKVSPITFSSSDTSVATIDSNGVVTIISDGTTIIKASFAGNNKYLPQEKQYTLNVNIQPIIEPEPNYYLTYNGHKYVDLGLPSGTKWSVYNMGATAVNEEGNETYYYANTTPAVSGNAAEEDIYVETADDADRPEAYSKYNDTDYKRTLDMSDDAARVNWGGNWRIPSTDDFYELVLNTTGEIITNYLGRGTDGILFTSKINGNTLFFPLDNNGNWGAVKLMTNHLDAGECPAIWMFGRWWGDNPNEDYSYDEEAIRWYSYRVRPVF